ncbi:MAG: BtrH N-terminal domain-containing protein, partial [Bacteroidales bacterium]
MKIDFEHNQSAHCENGVTSNLLNYYGLKLSEPMVYGIGSGLFFAHMPFVKVNSIPVTSFRPFPGVIFRRVTRQMGITIRRKKFRDPDKAMKALNEVVDKGIPAGLLVGVYHLTYFPGPYRFHFNAHNIVVFGRENGNYIVSDPIMETPEELSYDDLKRVRFAKGLFAPNGHMYYTLEKPG